MDTLFTTMARLPHLFTVDGQEIEEVLDVGDKGRPVKRVFQVLSADPACDYYDFADQPVDLTGGSCWVETLAGSKARLAHRWEPLRALDYTELEKRYAGIWQKFEDQVVANRGLVLEPAIQDGKEWEQFTERMKARYPLGNPDDLGSWLWKHGTYCGPLDGLAQQPALLRPDPDSPDHVLAQFDALELVHDGEQMAFGWRRFPAKYFDTDNDDLRVTV